MFIKYNVLFQECKGFQFPWLEVITSIFYRFVAHVKIFNGNLRNKQKTIVHTFDKIVTKGANHGLASCIFKMGGRTQSVV